MKPSDDPERIRERVRLHRMQKRLQPKQLRAADSNLYDHINAALTLMAAAKAGIRNPALIAKQGEAMELVHRIYFGPEEANATIILMNQARAGLRDSKLIATQEEAMELVRQLNLALDPEEEEDWED